MGYRSSHVLDQGDSKASESVVKQPAARKLYLERLLDSDTDLGSSLGSNERYIEVVGQDGEPFVEEVDLEELDRNGASASWRRAKTLSGLGHDSGRRSHGDLAQTHSNTSVVAVKS